MPLPKMMPSRPPIEVRKTASIRNCQRISRRRAPSALRTPISRVRSVTEIIMIAITPMPPTISAIDEMTTSAEERGLADLVPDLEHGVLGREVEVVRRIELQVVADAQDRLDLLHRRSRIPSRGTTAIIAVRKTAGLKLLALIFADPFSTLPNCFSCAL